MTRVITFGLGTFLLLLLLASWRDEEQVDSPEETQPMKVAVKTLPPEEVTVEEVQPEAMPEPTPQPTEPVVNESPMPEQEVAEAITPEPPAPSPTIAPASTPAPDSLPSISAEYRQTLGFYGYVSAMRELGGRFFLYDDARDKILAEVDPVSGDISEVDASSLKGLSPRLRELSDEPEARSLLKLHRERFDAVRLKLVLLIPQGIENLITQQLRSGYETGRIPAGEWVGLEGVYLREGGQLVLRLDRARAAQGLSAPMQLSVYL